MADYVAPPSPCPDCGRIQDRAAGVGHDHAPEPGDVSVCLRCGAVSVLDAGLLLRKPTDAELVEIMLSDAGPVIEKAQRAIRRIGKRRSW